MTSNLTDFHEFEIPPNLKQQYDIKRIAMEGSTMLVKMDGKAIRFDIESKFKNTTANFEKQAKGLGIIDQNLKEVIIEFLSEQRKGVFQTYG